MSKILIVEDELDLASQIADWLKHDGYVVETVTKGTEALDYLNVYKYDAVILDWMLPGLDGVEVCKRYRNTGGKIPILMLTARSSVDDKALGLDAGADDYLSKPFHLKELAARLRALIRRSSNTPSPYLTAGDISLDPVGRTVTVGGAAVHLEPKEFNLLEFFMRHPNRAFGAEALIQRVWESESNASPDTVRTYIRALRKKLSTETSTCPITTVHGVGYKFDSP